MLRTKTAVQVADAASEKAYIEKRNPLFVASVEFGEVRTVLLVSHADEQRTNRDIFSLSPSPHSADHFNLHIAMRSFYRRSGWPKRLVLRLRESNRKMEDRLHELFPSRHLLI